MCGGSRTQDGGMRRPKIALALLLAAAVFASGGGLAANASWCAKLTLGAVKIAAGMLGLTPLSVVWERNGQPVDLAEDTLTKGDVVSFESRIDLSIVGQGVQAGLSVDFTPPAGSMTGVTREVLDRNGHPIGALSGSATPVDSVDFGRIMSTSEIAKLDKKTDYVTRFRFTVGDNPIELGMALAKAKLRLQAGGWKAESKNLSLYGFQAETPKMSRIATPNYALDGQGNVWAWSENGELVGTGEGKQYLPKQATKGIKFIDIGVTGGDQPAYDDVAVSDSKCGIGLDENRDLWLLPWKGRKKPVKLDKLGKFTKASYGPIMNTGQVRVINCDGTVSEKNKFLSGVEEWPTDYVLWANRQVMVNQDGEAWMNKNVDYFYSGNATPWKITGDKKDPVTKIFEVDYDYHNYCRRYAIQTKSGSIYTYNIKDPERIYGLNLLKNKEKPIHATDMIKNDQGVWILTKEGEIVPYNNLNNPVYSPVKMKGFNTYQALTPLYNNSPSQAPLIGLGEDNKFYITGFLESSEKVDGGLEEFVPAGGYRYTPGNLSLKPKNNTIGVGTYSEEAPTLRVGKQLYGLGNQCDATDTKCDYPLTINTWKEIPNSGGYSTLFRQDSHHYSIDKEGMFFHKTKQNNKPEILQFLGRKITKIVSQPPNNMLLLDYTGRIYSNTAYTFGGIQPQRLKYVHLPGNPNIIDITQEYALSDKGDLYALNMGKGFLPRKTKIRLESATKISDYTATDNTKRISFLTKNNELKELLYENPFEHIKRTETQISDNNSVRDFTTFYSDVYWIDDKGDLWTRRSEKNTKIYEGEDFTQISSNHRNVIVRNNKYEYWAKGYVNVLGLGYTNTHDASSYLLARININIKNYPTPSKEDTLPTPPIYQKESTTLVDRRWGSKWHMPCFKNNSPAATSFAQNILTFAGDMVINKKGQISQGYNCGSLGNPKVDNKFWFLDQTGTEAIDNEGVLWDLTPRWVKHYVAGLRFKWVYKNNEEVLAIDTKGHLYKISLNPEYGNYYVPIPIASNKKFTKAWATATSKIITEYWALDTEGQLWGSDTYKNDFGIEDNATVEDGLVKIPFPGKTVTQITYVGTDGDYVIWFLDSDGQVWASSHCNYIHSEYYPGTGLDQESNDFHKVLVPEKVISLNVHEALSETGHLWTWGNKSPNTSNKLLPSPSPLLTLPDREPKRSKPRLIANKKILAVVGAGGRIYVAGAQGELGMSENQNRLVEIPRLDGKDGILPYDDTILGKTKDGKWQPLPRNWTIPENPLFDDLVENSYGVALDKGGKAYYQTEYNGLQPFAPWLWTFNNIFYDYTESSSQEYDNYNHHYYTHTCYSAQYTGLETTGKIRRMGDVGCVGGYGPKFVPSVAIKNNEAERKINFKAIAAKGIDTYAYTAGVSKDDKLYVWGDNSYGQLGLGDTSRRDNPTEVTLPDGKTPKAVYATNKALYVLTTDGILYAAGYQSSTGELGIGNNQTGDIKTFHRVLLPEGAKISEVSVQDSWGAAITTTGNLYTWGSNSYGQLATGNTDNQPVPVKAKYKN